MTKSSKILLWAMLGVVLVLILSIVLSGLLMNGRTEEVDNTEFFRLIETQTFTEEDGTTREVSIDEIRIDLYNVSAIDRDGKEENSRVLVIYKTTIGRFSAEYERIIAAAEKTASRSISPTRTRGAGYPTSSRSSASCSCASSSGCSSARRRAGRARR